MNLTLRQKHLLYLSKKRRKELTERIQYEIDEEITDEESKRDLEELKKHI